MVDLQRRVVALGTHPRPAGAVVENASSLARAFRGHGRPVVCVRTVNLDRPDRHGDELVDALDRGEALVVTKHQWSAFHGTPLDLHLRRAGIQTVVLAGLMTNFGVEGSARAADELGYGVVVAEDATASVSREAHAFSVREILPRLGAVTSADEVVRALDVWL